LKVGLMIFEVFSNLNDSVILWVVCMNFTLQVQVTRLGCCWRLIPNLAIHSIKSELYLRTHLDAEPQPKLTRSPLLLRAFEIQSPSPSQRETRALRREPASSYCHSSDQHAAVPNKSGWLRNNHVSWGEEWNSLPGWCSKLYLLLH